MFRCRMGKKTVPGGRKIYTLVLHPDKKKPDTVQWNDTELTTQRSIEKKKTWARIGCRAFPTKN